MITIQPKTEEVLIKSYQKTEHGAGLSLDPSYFEKLVTSLQRTLEQTVFSSGIPVLLVHPLIRPLLKRLIDRFIPNLTIVSANEVASNANVKSLATVEAA